MGSCSHCGWRQQLLGGSRFSGWQCVNRESPTWGEIVSHHDPGCEGFIPGGVRKKGDPMPKPKTPAAAVVAERREIPRESTRERGRSMDVQEIARELRAEAEELIRQAETLEAVVARVMARKGRTASSTAAAADETPKRARRSGVRRTETKARWEVIRDHVFNNYGDHPFLVCDVVEVLKLKKGDFWNSVQKAGFERVDRGQYRLPAEKMKGVGDEED